MKKLGIIGASGHGKVIADIAKKNGYSEISFFDDNENIHECGSYPVTGKSAEARIFDGDIIVGIGNAAIRKKIQEMIPAEKLVTLIHPDAVIAEDVVIGAGTVIMAGPWLIQEYRLEMDVLSIPVLRWIMIVKWAIMYIFR